MEDKPIRYDVDGMYNVTATLRQLLNQFPGLLPGEEITFSTLTQESGIAMFPISGAVIQTETVNICDEVKQVCLYPFYIVYRQGHLNQNRKANIKEWLDNLGKWLEKQPVMIDETEYKLTEYPVLSGHRKFDLISRQTPAYLDSVGEDQVEDWAIYISAQYKNEFKR